jgi:hypothetical protein
MCGSPTICKDYAPTKVGVSNPGSSTGKSCPTMGFHILEDIGFPREVGMSVPGDVQLPAMAMLASRIGIENQCRARGTSSFS